MSGFICTDCGTRFTSEPRCTTCGAEKLYGATLRALASQRDALKAERDACIKAMELARYRLLNVGVVGKYLGRDTILRESVLAVFDAAMRELIP